MNEERFEDETIHRPRLDGTGFRRSVAIPGLADMAL
jgi:hypothetical protein